MTVENVFKKPTPSSELRYKSGKEILLVFKFINLFSKYVANIFNNYTIIGFISIIY